MHGPSLHLFVLNLWPVLLDVPSSIYDQKSLKGKPL